MRRLPFIAMATLIFLLQFGAANASTPSFALQAGALGDSASIGNKGVQVSIRTHIVSVTDSDYDYSYWVGDNLADGSFVQFGYTLMKPGHYCMRITAVKTQCPESEIVRPRDARWFWQYWPKIGVTNYFYGIGPELSAGPEGTWHTYGMIPNESGGWNFVLDDRVVDRVNASPALSKDPAYVVAEVVTSVPSATRSLGSVEFSNLAYYAQTGWHPVTSLTTISSCG